MRGGEERREEKRREGSYHVVVLRGAMWCCVVLRGAAWCCVTRALVSDEWSMIVVCSACGVHEVCVWCAWGVRVVCVWCDYLCVMLRGAAC